MFQHKQTAGGGGAAATRDALGPVAARLAAETTAGAPLIVVTADEPRAEALSALLAAMIGDDGVALLPAPDHAADEPGGPSAALAGRRAAALARVAAGAARVIVASADALRRPVPQAAPEPLALAVGDAFDGEALAAALEERGYRADDRVDEPGEYALRAVLDIFPADAALPVRIACRDGRIAAMRHYDPLTQRSGDEIASVALWPAAEPVATAAPLAALPPAPLLVEPDARARLARVDGADARGQRPLTAPDAAPGRRFVAERNPARALFAAIRAARADGARVLLAGSPRDLRYLSRRVEKALGEAPARVGRWADALAAPPGALLGLELPLDAGWSEPGFTVIAAADALGSRAGDAAEAAADPFAQVADGLAVGDVVIHEDHGLAVLRGLDARDDGDHIRLEHAGGAARLVPAADAARLWRYGGDADAVTLDKADGSTWATRRADVDAAIREDAAALLALAAERAARRCDPIEPPVAAFEAFVAGFPFSETRDQTRAIAAVRADLASGRPMDRLVVGDVGYGKTEVALRAAAMAALAGHQVAIVAPTTVLVRQHAETFARRFAGTGVEVAGLSRLTAPAEAKRVKAGLADGSIRVVVGTRMVAGKGVSFRDLALVVIDEEQRFGQADKAKLRALSDGRHSLALSATPIPRTLQGALAGLVDLSVLASPPARRQPIRTAVSPFDPALAQAALRREKARGGQSFVVVPRIEDMAPMAEQLARLVPGLTVMQAHGKLPAAEIDAAMVEFAAGRGDVLLATNIIEAGLDVPRANTMVVHHADRFGLAQLHQLRGRVGRGGRRGAVLLLTDGEPAPATLKRLRTLEAFDRLGAGFEISAQDLDARGGGDLAGERQSGHVKLIGVALHRHLLGRALRAARLQQDGGEADDDWMPTLELGGVGRIPEAYLPEVDERLTLHARIARAETPDALDALAEELEDRFGALPAEVSALLDAARLRLLARAAGVARVAAGPQAIALTPRDADAAPPAGLDPRNGRWIAATPTGDGPARLEAVRKLLEEITS